MSKIIGRTANGVVVIDRPNSHIHPDVEPLIAEALSKINTRNLDFIEVEVDFDRVIGASSCVQTTDNDVIVFAQRPNRKGLTRFVLDRQKEMTSKVMVVLKKAVNQYVLITSFIGEKGEVEPWDAKATNASIAFWKNRALVWGEQVLIDTVTAQSPY